MKPTMTKPEYTFSQLLAAQDACSCPDFWKQLTQETAQTLRAAADKSYQRASVAVVAVQFLMAAGGAYLGWNTVPDSGLLLKGSAAVFLGLFVWVVTIGVALMSEPAWSAAHLLEQLQPVADEPERCESALALLKEPEARAWRDQVVADGRELLVGDLRRMELICDAVEDARAQERRGQACRTLHGFGQASGAGV